MSNDTSNGGSISTSDGTSRVQNSGIKRKRDDNFRMEVEKLAINLVESTVWLKGRVKPGEITNGVLEQLKGLKCNKEHSESELKRIVTVVALDFYGNRVEKALEKAEEKAEKALEAESIGRRKADGRLKAFEAESIGRLIELQDESNTNVEVVQLRKKFRIYINPGDKGTSHVKTSHTKATPSEGEFEMDLVTFHDSAIEDRSSAALGVNWPKGYTNEPDVQKFVGTVLDDAVKYVNWILNLKVTGASKSELEARPEMSMFSNKPDHLVVYNMNIPIASVEVKKPHKDIFSSETVAGQILDYIMIGKLTTGKFSFGVVTSFTNSRVAWVDSDDSKGKAKMKGRLDRVKLEELSSDMAGGTSQFAPSSTPARAFAHNPKTKGNQLHEEKAPLQSQSPPQLLPSVSFSPPSSPNENRFIRGIKYSKKTYQAHQLFTLFCNVIVASLSTAQKKLSIRENFTCLQKDEVVMLLVRREGKEKGHRWMKIENHVNIKGPWKFNNSEKHFHLVEHLGAGDTSRVWRAVVMAPEKATDGYDCVIKYWIKVYDGTNLWNDKTIETESKNAAEREVANYHAIYSEFESYVGKIRMDACWCVILPFFAPIEKANRESVLNGVKDLLLGKFYINGKSYQFKECDQRWRHVGRWGDEIVLFDLADLEVKETGVEDHERYVESHIQVLKQRCSTTHV